MFQLFGTRAYQSAALFEFLVARLDLATLALQLSFVRIDLVGDDRKAPPGECVVLLVSGSFCLQLQGRRVLLCKLLLPDAQNRNFSAAAPKCAAASCLRSLEMCELARRAAVLSNLAMIGSSRLQMEARRVNFRGASNSPSPRIATCTTSYALATPIHPTALATPDSPEPRSPYILRVSLLLPTPSRQLLLCRRQWQGLRRRRSLPAASSCCCCSPWPLLGPSFCAPPAAVLLPSPNNCPAPCPPARADHSSRDSAASP
mmetsp:Transcript_12622/g.26985  ORF Transcript_12622/g.26985 Transcript_12622/m.26985 type:complete len:259 (+) Transcript_12622:657-1433(+)